MSEMDRIALQAALTEMLDKWLDKQADVYSISACSECARMMASAAMAVLEASTKAEAEAER